MTGEESAFSKQADGSYALPSPEFRAAATSIQAKPPSLIRDLLTGYVRACDLNFCICQLSSCRRLTISDTPIIRTAAESPEKRRDRHLTETNPRF